jgi:hypothetical protein
VGGVGHRRIVRRGRQPLLGGKLTELAGPISAVAERAGESHVLMNNCHADDGVRNAAQLRAMLS